MPELMRCDTFVGLSVFSSQPKHDIRTQARVQIQQATHATVNSQAAGIKIFENYKQANTGYETGAELQSNDSAMIKRGNTYISMA